MSAEKSPITFAEKSGQAYEAICKIMKEINPIAKEQKNPQQGYKFRGIDDVYNELNPLFGKHGVFPIPRFSEIQREERKSKSGGILTYTTLKLELTLYAADGSCVPPAVVWGEAMDAGDKSTNKAMSAAYKYALLQMFCIPTEEVKDTEAESPEPVATPEVQMTPPTGLPTSAQPRRDYFSAINGLFQTKDQRHAWQIQLQRQGTVSSDSVEQWSAEDFEVAIQEANKLQEERGEVELSTQGQRNAIKRLAEEIFGSAGNNRYINWRATILGERIESKKMTKEQAAKLIGELNKTLDQRLENSSDQSDGIPF